MSSSRKALLLTPLLLLGLTVSAAAEPVLLEEIVIRGEEIPPKQEILSIREVRESPARDIGEAASQVPGLESLRKGAIANDIVLRGLQRDNINVLMDGVRVQGGCPSRMDPPAFHFDFAEVESIDVVKGPYDLRYAGSMGGQVNAVGKTAPPGPGASAVVSTGSYEMLHSSLTGSYATDKYDALAGYAYKYSLPPKSGDDKRITDIYPATSRNRYRDNKHDDKAYDISTVWVKGGAQLTDSLHSELSLAHQDAEHVLYPALLMDADHDRTSRASWTTTLDAPAGVLDEARLQVYWTDVDHLMHDKYRESSRPSMMVTRDYMMETDADTEIIGAYLTGRAELGPGQLHAGLDGFARNWDAVNRSAMYLGYANQPMIPDVDHDQFGAFAEYSWPLGKELLLEGGLRLDYADADATKLDDARIVELYQPYHPGSTLHSDNDFFEPTANLQLTWTPRADLELFVGLASASRMPDPEELYIGLKRIPTMMMNTPSWVGNPDLDPVRNNQADLGVKFTGATFFLNGSLFYSNFDDYIYMVDVPDPDGPGAGTLSPARTYDNIDARIWGGELSGQASLPWDLYVKAELAYTEGEDRDRDEPLAEIPPLAGSVALRYDNNTWFVEIQERFADKQDRVDDNLNEEETSGWGVTDLKTGLTLSRWSVLAGINNLFDKYYYTHLSYQRDPFRTGAKVPETGAFAYLTVKYDY